MGKYAAQALQQHMTEGLLPDPLADAEAQAWLEASDAVLGNPIVHCAVEAFGLAAVVELGERCEAAGQLWLRCSEDLQ